MELTDTFIRHVTANGKIQKHSDGGGLYLCRRTEQPECRGTGA